MKTEHLLIIRFSAIGDIAMLVPVVASLAIQYPCLRITVLSKPFARTLFENIAPNVGFMEADLAKENHGIHGLNILYRRLSSKRFTAVADMHDVLRTKYLRMRFNIDRYRVEHIDKHRQERRLLCANRHKEMRPLPSSFKNYADVLRRLGYPVRLDFHSIFPPSGGDIRLLPPPMGDKKDFQQWIGIAPFAAHASKIYPLEKMEKVIETLCKRHPDCRIFLFGGGESEHKTMGEWEKKYSHCTNASAQTTCLYEELILMSHLDVILSMDSANMHLASITGTTVVSVWGATHPYAGFMGWNQSYDNVIQVQLPCRPCSIYGNRKCNRKDYACLYKIAPETIADKIDKVLNNINIKQQKDHEEIHL